MHIFYRPEMSVPGIDSFSPSAAKPKAFVGRMLCKVGTVIHSFEPITKDDLYICHDRRYVDGVFDLSQPNGFDKFDPRVPESTLYTVGSLVAACLQRRDMKGPVCSPTSGFHHAGYAFGGGFCTFNGLMVAAEMYLRDYPSHKVGIIDCDVHYGNGTSDIINRGPMKDRSLIHFTAGKHCREDDEDPSFELLLKLRQAIRSMADCDLIIYQAGADMAAGDPLGGYLSPTAMAHRDGLVFEAFGNRVVWNLAGGYRTDQAGTIAPVLRIHERTASIAAFAFQKDQA